MLFLWLSLVVYVGALAAISVLTYRWGGPNERFALNVLLSTALASQFASFFGGRWRHGPEYLVASCDAALAIGLLVVVWRSNRFWPLWAAAAGLVGVITHAIRWLAPSLSREVYASIQPFWAFPVMLAILIGAVGARQKR